MVLPPEEYDVGLEIEWYAIGRRLSFLWCAMPEGPSGTGLTQETDYSLPFWPTSFAASPSQAGDFYVAGWTERGRTRILKLHVSAPQVGLVQEPGGGSSFSLVPGAVTRTSEIYDADTNQVGFIGNLFENKANSTHLFLHEFPSGDLYDLDLPSGVRTLLASTTGSPQSQDLTGPYNGAVSMDHAVHGYSYVLTHTNYSLGESQRPNLVYFDVDRNGTLDSILSPSDSEYAQLDMLNPSATTGWD